MKHYIILIALSFSVISCSKQKTDLPNVPPPPPPPVNKTLPTVNTLAATSITTTYAIIGCSISSNGSDIIKEMGICYSFGDVTLPTILNEKIFINKEVNIFSDTLKKLAPNTNYYARAYAINSIGVAYGKVTSFKTQQVIIPPPPPPPTTMIDYDGNVYNVIKIGDQYWTKENFRCEHYNDGTEIIQKDFRESSFKDGALGWYIDPFSFIKIKNYGGYYNWYAVKTGKLAPNGWHVPTRSDMNKLKSALTPGMEGQEMKSIIWDGAFGFKDTMTNKPNRNKSGFTAHPYGDYRGSGLSSWPPRINTIIMAFFWISDQEDLNNAYFFSFLTINNDLNINHYPKNNGFQIRLVKD